MALKRIDALNVLPFETAEVLRVMTPAGLCLLSQKDQHVIIRTEVWIIDQAKGQPSLIGASLFETALTSFHCREISRSWRVKVEVILFLECLSIRILKIDAVGPAFPSTTFPKNAESSLAVKPPFETFGLL